MITMAEMHPYRKKDLFRRLNAYLGMTLGEADSNHVFDRTIKPVSYTPLDVYKRQVYPVPQAEYFASLPTAPVSSLYPKEPPIM